MTVFDKKIQARIFDCHSKLKLKKANKGNILTQSIYRATRSDSQLQHAKEHFDNIL